MTTILEEEILIHAGKEKGDDGALIVDDVDSDDAIEDDDDLGDDDDGDLHNNFDDEDDEPDYDDYDDGDEE